METNLYHEFREHHAFESVRELVETLDRRLRDDAPEAYAEHEEVVSSILADLSWEDLKRQGERTMGENMHASYIYERPGLRLWLFASFVTETREFEDATLRATVGNDIEASTLSESDVDVRETVAYTVHPDGRITR